MFLITGVPRSGTTPLGHFFSEFADYPVIHEPFNFHTGIDSVSRYFEFAESENKKHLIPLLERVKRYDVNFKKGIFPNEPKLKSVAKTIVGNKTQRSVVKAKQNDNQQDLTIKDPFLALNLDESSEYFEKLFVTVRSPQGVCSSFEKYDWIFPEIVNFLSPELAQYVSAPVTEYLKCPQFNALALQCEFYKRLENVSNKEKVMVINMSKAPSKPETYYAELAEFFASKNLPNFMSWVSEFYTKESKWKGAITIHNHNQGVKNLTNKGSDWVVKPEYAQLFEVLSAYYEKYDQ